MLPVSILISGAFTYNSATCLSARFRRKQIIIFESRRGFRRNNIRSLFFSAALLHKLYVLFIIMRTAGGDANAGSFCFSLSLCVCVWSFCKLYKCLMVVTIKPPDVVATRSTAIERRDETKEYLLDLKRTLQFPQHGLAIYGTHLFVCKSSIDC